MGRKKGGKKHTKLKNVMICVGCAVFAGVYVTGICFAVQYFAGSEGHWAIPSWLDRVEIHVDGESAVASESTHIIGTDTMDSDNRSVQPEQEPRFEKEETAGSEQDKSRTKKTDIEEAETKEPEEAETREPEEAETEEPDTREKKKTQETEEPEEKDRSEEEDTQEPETKEDLEEESDSQTDPVEPETEENTGEKKKGEEIQVQTVKTLQNPQDNNVSLPNVTAIVKAVMPSVVSVRNEYTAYDYWYDEMYDDEASASGIIISQRENELVIVTNCHVVEDYNALYVTFIDGTEAEAYIKGVSAEEDIAVLSVFLEDIPDKTLDSIAIAVLGDSAELEVGEPAVAIGNALGYGQSVTTGIISAFTNDAFAEDYFDGEHGYLIQTDAAINPGNSGGALLNARGEVIGICEGKIADYVIEGMGYAIPITEVEPVIAELMLLDAKRKVPSGDRGFLGIAGTDVSENAMEQYDMPEGVYVSGVMEDTAAQKAGILKGDIIVSIEGEKVVHMTELQKMLEYYAAGTEIEVVVMRRVNGEYGEKTVEVVLERKKN